MDRDKIQASHRQRKAYVYVRQSTMQQITVHEESRILQYQMVQRAQALGWSESQVVVIDDDLGKSAISATERAGFQTLVAAVGLNEVGIILVADVSRLSRNCSDWYQLLDLASLQGTLIGDAQSIYDPRDYNDRLLLGLKGTFSEAQWHQMRQQLWSAKLNKARRGELAIRLPVGFERLETGSVVFSPDQAVQQAIRLVLTQFEVLGTARQVLLFLRDQQLDLPHRLDAGPDRGRIEWVKPSYAAIHRILHNPAYAGVYAYGKTRSQRLPGEPGKVVHRLLPMDEWEVFLRDAFPGYLSWEQYQANQQRLRANRLRAPWGQGPARDGLALLPGLVWCGRCGRQLLLRYSNQPAYVCHAANKAYGDPICQNFMVPHIDEAVSRIFLEAVQPIRVEAALAALTQVETQREQLTTGWQQRLERARYEVELARRRYERVDPDYRLVAAELEKEWEAKLQELGQVQQAWQAAQMQDLKPLSAEEQALIRQLAADLPALWQAETTTCAERKRLLRCLIQDVTLDAFSHPGYSLIHIRWHTGTTTTLEAERPRPGCCTAQETVTRIRELAPTHPDDRIAAILNAEGVPTATHKEWNRDRVLAARVKHDIPTGCPYYTSTPGPRGDGLVASTEAAARLGITPHMVSYWLRRGWIIGHQAQPHAAVWVRLTEADVHRWNGSAALRPDLIPVKDAPPTLGLSPEQMHADIRAGRLLTYRVRVGKLRRWYVQRPSQAVSTTRTRAAQPPSKSDPTQVCA